jgi:hypothetical protein
MMQKESPTALDIRIKIDPENPDLIEIRVEGKDYEVFLKAPQTGSQDADTHHHEHHHTHATSERPGHPNEMRTQERTAAEESHSSRSKALLRRQVTLGLATFTFLILFEALFAFLTQNDHQAVLREHASWLLYLDLTVVSLVATIGYLRMYRYAQTNHMTSMMIGMTIGMQVGMMTGGIIGANDGYFVGAMVGVILGTVLGVSTSWCCGPMAITQSLMSAVMGGTMGAMIVTMMPSEKLEIFMPLFTALNFAILVWFTRLFFRECVIGEQCRLLKPMSFGSMLATSLATVIGLYGLMALKPNPTAQLDTSNSPFHIDEVTPTRQSQPDAPKEMTCGGSMMKK